MNINDDDILNIEFYHDNKDNIKLLENCKYFYDTINEKIITLNDNFNYKEITGENCENLIKEVLTTNISYNNELLQYKTYDEEQNDILNFDNSIIVFDNSTLTKK